MLLYVRVITVKEMHRVEVVEARLLRGALLAQRFHLLLELCAILLVASNEALESRLLLAVLCLELLHEVSASRNTWQRI